MALYKYEKFITHVDHVAFDQKHKPGVPAPFAGVYRCTNCGHEIGIAKDHDLPPQNHFQHKETDGPILWQLVVHPNQLKGATT